MKIHQVLFLLFLFLKIPLSFSEASLEVQRIQNTTGITIFQKTLQNAHQRCYRFVTPLKIAKLNNPPFYELSKKMLKTLSRKWDKRRYQVYINETLVEQNPVHFFKMAYSSMENLVELVVSFCLTALIMIGLILTIRLSPGIFDILDEYLNFIGNFRISTVIPVLFIYFLLASTVEFTNSVNIAEDRLIIGHNWHHELTDKHGDLMKEKIAQFRCVITTYWQVMAKFEDWVNPYDFYKPILLNETDIFFKNQSKSLGEYLKETYTDDKKREHVSNKITQKFVDEMHNYKNGQKKHKLRDRTDDMSDMLTSYYTNTLQLPKENDYNLFKFSITILSIYTLIIAISVTILGFMDHKPWHDKILRILDWAQHGIPVIIIIKVIVFMLLAAQVCNTYRIQTTMNDENFSFLNETMTKNGINISFLLRDSYFTNTTLTQVMGMGKHVYDARPDQFQPNMSSRNLKFFEEYITSPDFEFQPKQFFAHISRKFKFPRFTNSLMKDVIVPVSTPVWIMLFMPIYHFGIAFYVMFAIPKLRYDREIWTNDNLI
ncbi:unnamed protein product [Caenorhabditis angaria]|uniref:Uncharacterized protein n=1 Tax=Caenorhabditis angaria TaxID=860376 RepID=A0A9P1ICU5_9PELO|nr:unnamed protein product [Caenorhabditis angaria]